MKMALFVCSHMAVHSNVVSAVVSDEGHFVQQCGCRHPSICRFNWPTCLVCTVRRFCPLAAKVAVYFNDCESLHEGFEISSAFISPVVCQRPAVKLGDHHE